VQRGGDATRADFEERCTRKLLRCLEVEDLAGWTADERSSLRRMAPALCLIDDLADWTRPQRRALARIVRAKAARSEAGAAARILAHGRLARGLRGVALGPPV
jgi:hypothetical protein